MTITDRANSLSLACSPRIFAAWYQTGSSDLHSHMRVHGELPIPRHPHADFTSRLLEDLRVSGLTGRGGACFPTARKWETLRRTRHPLVVVNAMEGEPASDKEPSAIGLCSASGPRRCRARGNGCRCRRNCSLCPRRPTRVSAGLPGRTGRAHNFGHRAGSVTGPQVTSRIRVRRGICSGELVGRRRR